MLKLGISKFACAAALLIAAVPAWAQQQFQVGATGTAASVNNWPAAENPGATRDSNSATKYLNFAKLNTGLIETIGTSTVTGIRFTTANDSPNRDPLTYSLYGSNSATTTGTEAAGTTFNLSSFTPIVTAQPTGLTVDPGRLNQGSVQTITNATQYSTYLIVFPTLRDAATANSMQIADVILFGAAGPITIATTPINGGALVPEPASAGILLTIGGLAATIRRRRKC
jgi:hypothetical protein